MIVSGHAESFVVSGNLKSEDTGALSLGLSCVLGWEETLLLCILCLSVFGILQELFLVLTIPIFFFILANGAVWSHLHHSVFCGAVTLGVGCSCSWSSIFMGGLEFVAVATLLVRGISSKSFPDIFPALGQEVLA